MGFIARLYRFWPLLVVLAVLAGVIYLVVTFRHTPEKAKAVLIKIFLALTIALSVFFGLASLYALLDGSEPVLDLALSCLILSLVLLGVTLLCRWRFLKNHPNYRFKPVKAKVIHRRRWPWSH